MEQGSFVWVPAQADFFSRPLQDGGRATILAEKRKQLFKQFKNWLDSKQFSTASLNLHYRNVSFSN